MNTNNKMMESLEDCRTSLLEVEVLRQEVTDILDETFPDCAKHHVDRVMSYYYIGHEEDLHVALVHCAYAYSYADRNINIFLDDLADEVLSGREAV